MLIIISTEDKSVLVLRAMYVELPDTKLRTCPEAVNAEEPTYMNESFAEVLSIASIIAKSTTST